MTEIPPMMFDFIDGHMVPLDPKLAANKFWDGASYKLAVHEEPSMKSRGHYFASIKEAWDNFSDEQTKRWPSSECLRKWALIETGFCDTETLIFATHEDALVCAGFARRRDQYVMTAVRDSVLVIYTAQSQKAHVMGKARFQRSKEEVFRIIAEQIGVTPEQLKKNRAA